jgi:hypothetical protein
MKSFKISMFSLLCLAFSSMAIAQDKTEKIQVSGECGMCKSKIEKAAKEAGASSAEWSAETKELTVSYASNSTNTAKIEKAIAAVGYDTKNVKASDEAYNKLHDCCKYERTSANEAKADCCKDGQCEKCKEGKCDKGMDCKAGKCEHHSEAEHAAKGKHACCKKA